jgi:hypothetical protein
MGIKQLGFGDYEHSTLWRRAIRERWGLLPHTELHIVYGASGEQRHHLRRDRLCL